MAIKTKAQQTVTNNANITDPTNKQNTAARVREVTGDLIDSSLNLLDSQTINLVFSSTGSPTNSGVNTNVIASNGGTNSGNTSVLIASTSSSNGGDNCIVSGTNVLNQNSKNVIATGDKTRVIADNSLNTGSSNVSCAKVAISALTVGAGNAVFVRPLAVPAGFCMNFRITVLAVNKTNGDSKELTCKGLMKNIGGSLSFVGSPTIVSAFTDAGITAASISVTLNGGTQSLEVNALSGGGSFNIEWGGTVEYELVRY